MHHKTFCVVSNKPAPTSFCRNKHPKWHDQRIKKFLPVLYSFGWFYFSVIKRCLSTVPKIFVKCFKRTAIGDHDGLSRPAVSSTWCKKINLVSKEASSSCEVHCFHTARSRIQVFSNTKGNVWDWSLQNCVLRLSLSSAAGWRCGCH